MDGGRCWSQSRLYRLRQLHSARRGPPADGGRAGDGHLARGCYRCSSTGDCPLPRRRNGRGGAWKFAPLRVTPDRYELSLDNDCILWGMPEAIADWLDSGDSGICVLAADVHSCFGQFGDYCGPEPRNAGIHGLPPGFDLGAVLGALLEVNPTRLVSELDEQGLQVAALSHRHPSLVVRLDEVTICSPFPSPPPPRSMRSPFRRLERKADPLALLRPPRRRLHRRALGAPSRGSLSSRRAGAAGCPRPFLTGQLYSA